MKPIVVKGRIEFTEEENKEYSCDFTATLEDSSAFEYGNGTQVSIVYHTCTDGVHRNRTEIYDTRYDSTIHRNFEDFKTWLRQYFYEHKCNHRLFFYQ